MSSRFRQNFTLRTLLPLLLASAVGFCLQVDRWGHSAWADDSPARDAGPLVIAQAEGQPATTPATPKTTPESTPGTPATKPTPTPAPTPARTTPLSVAERVAELTRRIAEGEAQLKKFQFDLEDPKSDFAKAQSEFEAADKELQGLKQKKETLKDQNSDEAAALDEEIQKLEKGSWKLAKERFDLAIRERKIQQEKITALSEEVAANKVTLASLTGTGTPPTPPTTPDPNVPTTPPTTPTTPAPATTTTPPAPTTETPAPPLIPGAPATTTTGAPTTNQPLIKIPSVADTKQLEAARELAKQKEAQAEEARVQAEGATTQIATLRKRISTEQELLRTIQEKIDLSNEARRALVRELTQKFVQGASQDEIKALQQKLEDEERRQLEANENARQINGTLRDLQQDLTDAQASEIQQLREARLRNEEAETAKQELADLENPFSFHNITAWLLMRTPRALGIILGTLLLLWLARLAERQMRRVLLPKSDGEITERENRAQTLLSVFHSAAVVVLISAGVVLLLEEIGFNVSLMLGGAAVFGLAIAFGTQNLIRDYFYGFVILLENQYTVNDVVKIGDFAGQVERISLRLTVLRDLDGTTHFIPNGQILSVSNLTHIWARALFDVQVAYHEDADRVMDVLISLGREIRRDPKYMRMILSDMEMWGVDKLGDSGITIRCLIKTQPLQRWNVQREMLRRIKKRFDELGIEFPFPQRTVHVRNASDTFGIKLDELPAGMMNGAAHGTVPTNGSAN